MTSATAEPQMEQETEPVTFIAKCDNQIITRRAEDTIHDLRGRPIEQINRTNELRKLEEENRLRLARGEEPVSAERLADVAAPWKIEFGKDDPPHQFRTNDPVLIDFLRDHENFNTDGPSGFWELGAAPDEPKPTLTEQNVRLAKAQAIGDIEGIEEVLAIERETHNREPIIQGAEAALQATRELLGQAAPAGDADQTGDPLSTSQP